MPTLGQNVAETLSFLSGMGSLLVDAWALSPCVCLHHLGSPPSPRFLRKKLLHLRQGPPWSQDHPEEAETAGQEPCSKDPCEGRRGGGRELRLPTSSPVP